MSPKYNFTKKEVLGGVHILRNTNWVTPPPPCNIVKNCKENEYIDSLGGAGGYFSEIIFDDRKCNVTNTICTKNQGDS